MRYLLITAVIGTTRDLVIEVMLGKIYASPKTRRVFSPKSQIAGNRK